MTSPDPALVFLTSLSLVLCIVAVNMNRLR
jgi:hypothetical protein